MDKDDVVYLYNRIFAMKKNETVPFAATWMDLEMTVLNEAEDKYHILLIRGNCKKNDNMNLYAK